MEIISDFLEPYISIGADGVLIEGVGRIISWSDEAIELAARKNTIKLSGKRLKMEFKAMDALLIRGKVGSIVFGSVKR